MSEKKILGFEKSDFQKLKGMSFKELLRYPVHLRKDKPSTVEGAAERRREAKLYMIANACIMVALFVLVCLVALTLRRLLANFDVLVMPLAVIVMLFVALTVYGFFTWVGTKDEEDRLLDLQCDGCKAQIAYDESVEYEVLKSYEIGDQSVQNNKVHVERRFYTEVGVSCKCQKCGNEKLFRCEFVTEKWKDGHQCHLDKTV